MRSGYQPEGKGLGILTQTKGKVVHAILTHLFLKKTVEIRHLNLKELSFAVSKQITCLLVVMGNGL